MGQARLRIPAWSAPAPAPAPAVEHDPSPALVEFYTRVWREQMQDLPFVNPALGVEAVGFRRFAGDWVGIVITPWFVNVVLLPGGGTLWQDLPAGEQRPVAFPAGSLDFIADHDPARASSIAAFQYCPLIHPVQHLASPAIARDAAEAALAALFTPVAGPAAAPSAASSSAPSAVRANDSPAGEPAARAATGRRAFLRRLAGQGRPS